MVALQQKSTYSIYLSYISILFFINNVQVLRTRKLPRTYRETNLIINALVTCIITIFITMISYSHHTLEIQKDLQIVYSVVAINVSNFDPLYIPKVFIIYLKPNENTQLALSIEIQRRIQKDTNLDVQVTNVIT